MDGEIAGEIKLETRTVQINFSLLIASIDNFIDSKQPSFYRRQLDGKWLDKWLGIIENDTTETVY